MSSSEVFSRKLRGGPIHSTIFSQKDQSQENNLSSLGNQPKDNSDWNKDTISSRIINSYILSCRVQKFQCHGSYHSHME